MPHCTNCGADVKATWRYCGQCGTELVEMPRIRDALDLDSIPASSTLCKAFEQMEQVAPAAGPEVIADATHQGSRLPDVQHPVCLLVNDTVDASSLGRGRFL